MNDLTGNEMKRIDWIDITKGIGAIYVVIGHFCMNGKIQAFLSAFHMPLFFFLAGITFNIKSDESFCSFIKKKFTVLIIPYFIFSIPLFLFNFIEILYEKENVFISVIERVIGIFLCWKTTSLYNGIWFLPCMFVAYLYAWGIIKYCKKTCIIFMFIIMSIIVGFGFNYMQITLPLGGDTAFIAFSFMGIGFLLKERIGNIKPWLCIVYILLLISAYFNVRLTGISVDMSANHYGNVVLFYIASFSGIIATIGLAKVNLVKRIWIIEIGKEALYLYGAQMLLFAIVLKFSEYFNVFNEIKKLMIGFLFVGIVLVVCWAIKPIYYKLYNFIKEKIK